MSNFKYKIDESLNDIFYEQGNTYFALRKISWGDSDNYKVDIRKYYSSASGEETMSKGVSLSDEATDSLTESLVKNGYGNTKEMLKLIMKRENYDIKDINEESINKVIESEEEEYYSAEDLFGIVR